MNFNAFFSRVEAFLHKLYNNLLKLIKMAKKKKDLNINIDTKKVDVKISRKDGKLDVEIDTPIIDAHIEKDEELKVDIKADESLKPNVQNVVNTIIRKIVKSRK